MTALPVLFEVVAALDHMWEGRACLMGLPSLPSPGLVVEGEVAVVATLDHMWEGRAFCLPTGLRVVEVEVEVEGEGEAAVEAAALDMSPRSQVWEGSRSFPSTVDRLAIIPRPSVGAPRPVGPE